MGACAEGLIPSPERVRGLVHPLWVVLLVLIHTQMEGVFPPQELVEGLVRATRARPCRNRPPT